MARIAPDAMHYGHPSGCTYSENGSWRKWIRTRTLAEIRADATQVWPFIVLCYVMDRLKRLKVLGVRRAAGSRSDPARWFRSQTLRP
jgi:hypothetical protein